MTERELLAAEHALGLLTGEDLIAARGLLASDPEFAAMVAEWEARLAPMAERFPPVEPGAEVWPRIEAALAASPKSQVIQLRAKVRRWQAGAGVAAAAALVLAVISLRPDAPVTPLQSPAVPMAATLNSSSGGSVAMVWQPDARRLTANATRLAASAGHDYELWLLPKGGAPRSLGLIRAGERFVVKVPQDLLGQLGGDSDLAITLEQPGGSHKAGPGGPVVASGTIS